MSRSVKKGPYIDRFFVDIKTLDPWKYKKYTEGRLSLALKNLKKLKKLVGSDKITVRIPTIPDFVDSALQEKEAQKLKKLGFTDIDNFVFYVTNLTNCCSTFLWNFSHFTRWHSKCSIATFKCHELC